MMLNPRPSIGTPANNPKDQNSSTVYFRIFAQSTDEGALKSIARAVGNISLRHYSGMTPPKVHRVP